MSKEKDNSDLQGSQVSFNQLIEIQSIYFNGFQLGLANSDINTILLQDGQPALRLNMSYTTAKTLLVHLQDIMGKLEEVTDHKIMTTMQVNEGLQKLFTKKSDD